jgi:hypothetical protein
MRLPQVRRRSQPGACLFFIGKHRAVMINNPKRDILEGIMKNG